MDAAPDTAGVAHLLIHGGRIAEEARAEAIHALAWYRSFRYPNLLWGVFVRAVGVADLAVEAFRHCPWPLDRMADLAYRALLSHELTYYHIDRATAQFELLGRRALWLPRKTSYWRVGGYDANEESIANAAMLRAIAGLKGSLLRLEGRTAALRRWTRCQPHGYRTGYRYTSTPKFIRKLDEHGSAMLRMMKLSAATRVLVSLSSLYERIREEAAAVVPLYLVIDNEPGMLLGDVGAFPRVEIVEESKAFQKMFDKQPEGTRRKYLRLKQDLSGRAPAYGARMKPWAPGGDDVWSLRLDDANRLHLRHLGQSRFVAEAIGNHRAMGHG